MTDLETNRKELLELCLFELRHIYDNVLRSLDNLRNKALALLAAEVAIVAFLFAPSSGGFFTNSTPVYGYAIFGLGILLLTISFIIFLLSVSSVNVSHPPDEKDIRDIYKRFNNSPLEFMEYLKLEYMSALSGCINRVNIRSKRFMYGVYAFSIGIVLIILVKYCKNII